MMKNFSGLILKIMGWKVIRGIPPELKRAVVIVAPHTSMWDFVIGRLAWYAIGLKVKFLIKEEMFFFPFGSLLKRLGGIPVNRAQSRHMVDFVVKLFDQYDSLYITITPEGTRKLSTRWKRGFYYIAVKAKVPIAMAVLDYKKKEGGVEKIFEPSGDFNKDFVMIQDFYRGRGAKYPEKFNLS